MLILGYCGGPNAQHEETFGLYHGGMHDSAAVLLVDGEVVAAIEQERLDRIKHSNKAPFHAVRSCLEQAGVRVEDVDRFAFYGEEDFYNKILKWYFVNSFQIPVLLDARTMLLGVIRRELGYELPPDRLEFVGHHLAHAVSAMGLSGFERALVITADGQGDELAGLVADANGLDLRILAATPLAKSLGLFYLKVIEFLGYRIFDEYKVMGLAPYGDPGRLRDLFTTFYTLEPDGEYAIHTGEIEKLLDLGTPRRPREPVTQLHKDVAAALQEALEKVFFHMVTHYQKVTGHRHLCFAGGVAHNCTLNGKLIYSGLFDNVFVQPAAHDAGCALGAALHVYQQKRGDLRIRQLKHVYWGPPLGDTPTIEAELSQWDRFIDYERLDDLVEKTAALLADGAVIGWAQGRSEFGPRALGNRSILSDARPAENKDIINAMVKKREAYRPFAPSVPVERAAEFFEVPPGKHDFPFMVFTLKVREDKRALLGAVTHVDGSARLQTVSRDTNERYWQLLNAFGNLTGVPVLLNTSFNNNVEPIVESVYDALACYLTTQLHYLVVGDLLVRKKGASTEDHLELVPVLPPYARVRESRKYLPDQGGWINTFDISTITAAPRSEEISSETFELLLRVDGRRRAGELLNGASAEARRRVAEDLVWLWTNRLVALRARA